MEHQLNTAALVDALLGLQFDLRSRVWRRLETTGTPPNGDLFYFRTACIDNIVFFYR